MSKSEVKCSWVKCSVSLSNRIPNIIRGYIDDMKFAVLWLFILSYSFMFFCFFFIIVYMVVCFV